MNQAAAGRLALFARVASDRRLRRLVASYGVYSVAEQATWLAITVYAFNRGGIGEAGLVAFIQLAPAIVVSPLLSAAGDQYRTDVVLAAGYAAQAISMLATAAAMSMGAGPVIVYGAATVAAVSITLSRPAIGALLPAATPTPTHLAAARVCLGIIDNIGVLVGPMIAGLLLVSDDGPERVFMTMGALMIVATALVSGLGFARANVVPTVDQTAGDVWRETLGGFSALRSDGDLRLVVAIATLGGVIMGATDVLFVTVAEDLLDGSASKAGLFGAAFGLGALLGAVGSVSLILRSGLIVPLALAVAVGGVAIASMSAMSTVMLLAAAFVACGAGASLADIAGASLVPRFAPAGVLSRVYGVMEGSRVAAVAFGSLAMSVVAEWLGLRLALVFVGLALPALLAPYASRLRRLDGATPPPDPALLRLLTGSPIFAHLPPSTLEQLLAGVESRHVGSGVEMIRQGDHGDEYFLIADGEVVVSVDGVQARVQGPGSGFGEIALVRDVPRTATVTTTTPATLYAVRRADFLAALTGTPTALRAADDHAQRHLDDDTTRRAMSLAPMPYRAGGATGDTGGTDAMRKQKDQRLDTIAAISLFQTSSKAQLKWLVPILTPVGVSAGTVLCTEGDPGRACYVVVAGEAKVSIGGDDIDTIGPGGFFGEMALLDGGPRVATVTAITDMDLLEMTRADFISVITEVPAIARNMLVAVGERLRIAHAQLHTGHVGI